MTQPASQLKFPFSVRPLMAGWNRGAYLVEGLGHCGGCHTPRITLGAEKGGKA